MNLAELMLFLLNFSFVISNNFYLSINTIVLKLSLNYKSGNFLEECTNSHLTDPMGIVRANWFK